MTVWAKKNKTAVFLLFGQDSPNRSTLWSARGVGSKPRGSLLPWAGLSPADKFRLFWILDSGTSSSLTGLISDGNMESSLTLVSSRYRLRALPVMDACENTTHFLWSCLQEARSHIPHPCSRAGILPKLGNPLTPTPDPHPLHTAPRVARDELRIRVRGPAPDSYGARLHLVRFNNRLCTLRLS